MLSRDELTKKLSEVVAAGGVQILLQGGLNPDLPIRYYEDLFLVDQGRVQARPPRSLPEEILFIARQESLTARQGPRAPPRRRARLGARRRRGDPRRPRAAADRDDEVHERGVARRHADGAPCMGLRSSSTMMYGTVDTAKDRILHLLEAARAARRDRRLHRVSFCWDYQHEEGTRIAAGETGTMLYLRQQAIARLLLDNVAHASAPRGSRRARRSGRSRCASGQTTSAA